MVCKSSGGEAQRSSVHTRGAQMKSAPVGVLLSAATTSVAFIVDVFQIKKIFFFYCLKSNHCLNQRLIECFKFDRFVSSVGHLFIIRKDFKG